MPPIPLTFAYMRGKSSIASRFSLPTLISVMVLALIGIIIIQYLWIDRTVTEKQNLIDQKVYQAVKNVDRQLSDFHVLAFTTDSLLRMGSDFYLDTRFNSKKDSFHQSLFLDDESLDCCYTDQEAAASLFEHYVRKGKKDKVKKDKDSGRIFRIELNSSINSDDEDFFKDNGGAFVGFQNFHAAMDSLDNHLNMIAEVGDLFDRIAIELRGGMTEGRLDSAKIAQFIKKEFKSSGLEPPNAWTLYDTYEKETVVQPKEKMNWDFDIPLFTNDIMHPGQYHLQLNTSNNNELIWADIRSMILMSLLFIAIIFFAFAFAIRLVIKHKKISQIKSDFINNMTHEFKTPLASISIAADSIVHPSVRNHADQIDKYVEVIQAEKTKLNDHVERILEVASLDKDSLDIPTEEVSINEIVKSSTQKLSLLLEERQVELSIDERGEAKILGNEFYLERVFTNIIENSIKYSRDKAEISISIEQNEDQVEVSISDNGIGMDKKQIEKVFDNFYRVQSGNVHNTKGFGLGLSYAKLITEKLKGTISMEGQLNKGCTVKLKFPLAA